METRGPWVRHSTTSVLSHRRVHLHTDDVTTPSGDRAPYDWMETPEVVRVAAVDAERSVVVVEQHHYLPEQRLWQLPGGGVDPGEDSREAAVRELAEETGILASTWRACGRVWPMPGLTPARVHLWLATDLVQGEAGPEASEADLRVHRLALDDVGEVATTGRMGCLSSAYLVLLVAQLL